MAKRRGVWILLIAAGLLLAVGVLLLLGRQYYALYYAANTGFSGKRKVVYLAAETDLSALLRQLRRDSVLMDTSGVRGFIGRSRAESFRAHGRYVVERGATTRSVMNMLLSRRQAPVNLVVPSVRALPELAQRLGRQLELDSATFIEAFYAKGQAEEYGFDGATFVAMLIPNTYQVYWTISAEQLLKRLHTEYERFWMDSRDAKARALGLSRVEVYTLASIVQEEVLHSEELGMVAGVYLNRLRKGMLLQACPTAKYAAGDMSIKRVLTKHTAIDSPYNTYRHAGLPPGPIRVASIQGIDAVLAGVQHDFLYFCAKSDFSGRHHFSRTGAQHAARAREYQQALNRRGIR